MRRNLITRICESCKRAFLFNATPSALRIGTGRYCSGKCYHKACEIPFLERFQARIGPKSQAGCILWIGTIGTGGYGVISTTGNSRNVKAHRVAYELANGPIPTGMFVCHRCDNPPCVNVDHLFLGTNAENTADKVAKGRESRGEKHRCSKLTWKQVTEIRERLVNPETTLAELAREYEVTAVNIAAVRDWKTWNTP